MPNAEPYKPTKSWNLDEILESLNLPKQEVTQEELLLLSDEIDDKILEKMVEYHKSMQKSLE